MSWRERGHLTDDEINNLPESELREAVRTFRAKHPEVARWVRFKPLIYGGALTGTLFLGGHLDPLDAIRSRVNGHKQSSPDFILPPGESIDVDAIKDVATAECARLLAESDSRAMEYTDDQIAKLKSDIYRDIDRLDRKDR